MCVCVCGCFLFFFKAAPFPFEAHTPLKETDSILDAMLVMHRYNLLRIPVIDASCTRLVNFMTQHGMLERIHELCLTGLVDMSQPISSIGLPFTKRVAAVNLYEPVINAFRLMAEKVLSYCSRFYFYLIDC